jgi:hypothetical protein
MRGVNDKLHVHKVSILNCLVNPNHGFFNNKFNFKNNFIIIKHLVNFSKGYRKIPQIYIRFYFFKSLNFVPQENPLISTLLFFYLCEVECICI